MTLRLDITFLTGRYVATSEHNREQYEWPPEPARVFSALVATWADNDEPSSAEREALQWLETQQAPVIHASVVDPDHVRSAVTWFVPVNDTSVIGLSETTRRGAKLADIASSIDELESAQSPNTKKLASLQKQQAKQRDVTAKVAAPTDIKPGPMATANQLLPESRTKQARYFPSVHPPMPTVSFTWPNATPPAPVQEALDGLAERVSRVGHSSSLTALRFLTEPVEDDRREQWTPNPDGAHTIRWIQAGQLEALERRHAEHQASKPRNLPKLGVAYRSPSAASLHKLAPVAQPEVEWLPFAFADGSRRLSAHQTVAVATAVRHALISHAAEPVPPVISGHSRSGGPLINEPHIAVVPAPFVSSSGGKPGVATGLLMGCVLLVPPTATSEDRQAVLAAVHTWKTAGFKLRMPGGTQIQLESSASGLSTLSERGWTHASNHWVTASPIALPRHPGQLRRGSDDARDRRWEMAHKTVRDAFTHSGFPPPTDIALSFAPFLAGAEHTSRYPAFRQGPQGGHQRVRQLLHAAVRFDEEVSGPMVIGSGRFVGLGLMRPLSSNEQLLAPPLGSGTGPTTSSDDRSVEPHE